MHDHLKQMSSDPDYAGDPEFSRLLRREPAINLQRVALEIARDEYPELDVDRYMNWFDEAARPLKPLVWKAETEADALQIISHAMATSNGARLCGQIMPFSSWFCSMAAATIRVMPMP